MNMKDGHITESKANLMGTRKRSKTTTVTQMSYRNRSQGVPEAGSLQYSNVSSTRKRSKTTTVTQNVLPQPVTGCARSRLSTVQQCIVQQRQKQYFLNFIPCVTSVALGAIY